MNHYAVFRKFYRDAGKRMCQDCEDFVENGSKILDLGCGSAIAGREFQKYFRADLIGIDVKDQMVEQIPFKIFDGINIPFPDNYFDYVLIGYVLHHAKDSISLLKESKRVVKKRILIYEDLISGFLSEMICGIHGATFSYLFQDKKGSANFRKQTEWEKIFKGLKLKLIFEKKVSSILNPVEKKLFVLNKI